MQVLRVKSPLALEPRRQCFAMFRKQRCARGMGESITFDKSQPSQIVLAGSRDCLAGLGWLRVRREGMGGAFDPDGPQRLWEWLGVECFRVLNRLEGFADEVQPSTRCFLFVCMFGQAGLTIITFRWKNNITSASTPSITSIIL